MSSSVRLSRLLGVAVITTAVLASPVIASAQAYPSYSQPAYQSGEDTIQGRIVAINDTWHITLYDDRGFNDNVELHQGTIINPTGLRLEVGMRVTILGYANGAVFEANEIDTAYQYYGAPVTPVYYGPGWWYPGYRYGYGPSCSLVLVSDVIIIREFYPRKPFWGYGDDRDHIISRWTPRFGPHDGRWTGYRRPPFERPPGVAHAYAVPTDTRRVDVTPNNAPRDNAHRAGYTRTAPNYVRRVDVTPNSVPRDNGSRAGYTRTAPTYGSRPSGERGSSSRASSGSSSSSISSSSSSSSSHGYGYRR